MGCARHFEVLNERVVKLLRVAIDHTIWVLAKYLHLAAVAVGGQMAFEPVLIAALLLAHLAVPAQFLQALCLDPVADLYVQACCQLAVTAVHLCRQV